MFDVKEKVRQHWNKLTARHYGCGALVLSNVLLLMVIGTALLVEWYLPSYVGSRLLPQLTAAAGIKGVSAQVRRIGFTGADLADVRLELDGNRALEVDSLRVDYVLPLLPWRGDLRVTSLSLSGAKIKAVWKDGVFRIPGLYPELAESKKAQAKDAPKKGEGSRFKLEEVRLSRCVFQVETALSVTEIPFSLALRQNNDGMMSCDWTVTCGEDGGTGTLEWRSSDERLGVKFNGIVHPKRYTGLIPGMQRWEGPGVVKYSGNAEIHNDGTGRRITANLDLTVLKLAMAGWTLENVAVAMPVRLSLDYGGGEMKYRLSNLAVSGLAGVVLERIDGTLKTAGDRLDVSGAARARIAVGKVGSPSVQVLKELVLEEEYQGDWSLRKKSGNWTLKGKTVNGGKGDPALQLQAGPGRTTVDSVTWNAHGEMGMSGKNFDLDLQAELRLQPELRWIMNGGKGGKPPLTVIAEVPKLQVSGQLNGGVWAGVANMTMAAVMIEPLGLKGSRVKVEMPLMESARPGQLRVENILLNGRHLADVELTVLQNTEGLAIDGHLKQDFLPGSDWRCRSQLRFKPYFSGELKLLIDPYRPPEPLQLGNYWPGMSGMTFNGKLEGGFEYRFGAGVIGGKAFFRLREGVVNSKKTDLEISGVEADLVLPSLPSLQTPPSQRLYCSKLRMGKTVVSDVDADYQIGNDGSLLLENFSAGWCGGHLYTHSLRMAAGQQNWKATIYCEGLILSQLIRELGIAQAEGQGAIHGRIPVNFGVSGIRMDPGFLYSVPGEKNNIRIRCMEHVLEGMPSESMEYSQLDLAVEALKNFNYEWAKLNFNTVGDQLHMEMQLDGKPEQPLPFAFKNGGFVRVTGPGAAFQGIQLDVNVSVPLNRLLNFNKNLNNLLRGKKL